MIKRLATYLWRHHLALLALFVVLGGTSYAAVNALPKNSVGSKQVINGSLQTLDLSKKARAALKGNRGLRGPAGAQGAQGAQGATGAQGVQGIQGPPGPFTNTLPSGMTVRGRFYMLGAPGANNYNADSISFGFQLNASPIGHYIKTGTAAPAECPGTYVQPEAAAGHLCVYENDTGNTTASRTLDQLTKTGSGVYSQVAGAGHSYTYGSWAVTAP
jgi:hypothetical protein